MRKVFDTVLEFGTQLMILVTIFLELVLVGMLLSKLHDRREEPKHEQYARAAMVYCIDEAEDTVTFIDGCGFIWAIKGVFDWEQGDLAALLMDNNGTAGTIGDDIVVDAWYSSLGWQIREGIA